MIALRIAPVVAASAVVVTTPCPASYTLLLYVTAVVALAWREENRTRGGRGWRQ